MVHRISVAEGTLPCCRATRSLLKGGDLDARLDKGDFRNSQDISRCNQYLCVYEKSKKKSEKQKNGSTKPVHLTR
jgi:hypothetical protein